MKNIRDGANLPALFAVLRTHSPEPVADARRLLRRTILQVMIGNVDAHAKDLSFFVSAASLRLAPAYDLVCGLVDSKIEHELAMAISDEFTPQALGTFDWAQFAAECKLPRRLVARELIDLCKGAIETVADVAREVIEEGGDEGTVSRVANVISEQARRLAAIPFDPAREDRRAAVGAAGQELIIATLELRWGKSYRMSIRRLTIIDKRIIVHR